MADFGHHLRHIAQVRTRLPYSLGVGIVVGDNLSAFGAVIVVGVVRWRGTASRKL